MKAYKVISKLNGKMETTTVYADDIEDIHSELEPDGHRIYIIEEIISNNILSNEREGLGKHESKKKFCPKCDSTGTLSENDTVIVCSFCDFSRTK